jgi:S1-C subfamily serine protease
MNMKQFKPLFIMGIIVLLVSLACGIGGGAAPTEAPKPETEAPVEVTEPPATEAPVETEAPAPTSGAISSLQDVKKAVIQIESQGTFIDPEFGLVLNGAGRGSGFIIDPSGIAVTNNHVVTGAALLQVWVGGESEPHNARVLGVSECSDLALIDIDGDGYDYLDWYTGDINVGTDMYIAGFPLGEPEFTLNKGVISKAKAGGETSWASVDSVLEYDATSNPGNSGGPVVTADGQVIAIHYASNHDTRQAFGISRDIVNKIIDDLKAGNNVDTIGVNGQAVSNEDGSVTGVWVSSVQSGSQADKAGVEPGDILIQMENLVLAQDGTLSQYCDILRSHRPGDTLSLTVLRWASGEILEGQLNGREMEVTSTFEGSTTSGSETTASGNDIVNPNASASGENYFYTEFDGGLDSWVYFEWHGKEDGYSAEAASNRLRFEIDDDNRWLYFIYNDYIYTNTRIDTKVENLGMNNNNISLICRYSDDLGWYEFNIANNGTYTILWYDNVSLKDYKLLYSGGSNLINMGKDVNEYTAICNNDKLTLGINGVEVRTVTNKNLKEGLTGISVSSFDVLPIIVEFDYFGVSVP